jgi:hypothetical protein
MALNYIRVVIREKSKVLGLPGRESHTIQSSTVTNKPKKITLIENFAAKEI